ncbi:hypothetical protein L207DRAFT_604377 [Hyaloscypha variabilis F]|uniref:Chitin-binding type-2 domain-containing protein n=1 Tax=Hyaloscypha variabilis (strain UAMH 11265 / GT02V1 / F) TaxID=1149755 RepID=A0A2J6R9B9_HYAVF|nr:hypothetical protein L207DRAFT_604377 [Hyaloscypha variabilis F]
MLLGLLLSGTLVLLLTLHNVAATPTPPPSVDSSGADIVIFHSRPSFHPPPSTICIFTRMRLLNTPRHQGRTTDEEFTAQICCTSYTQCKQKGWEFAKCCPDEPACPVTNYQNFFNPLRGGECIVGHQDFKCPSAK